MEGAREAWVDLSELAFASYHKGYEKHGKDDAIVFLYEFGRLVWINLEKTPLHQLMNDDARLALHFKIVRKERDFYNKQKFSKDTICQQAGFMRIGGQCLLNFEMLKLFCIDTKEWKAPKKFTILAAYCSRTYRNFAAKNIGYLRTRFENVLEKIR